MRIFSGKDVLPPKLTELLHLWITPSPIMCWFFTNLMHCRREGPNNTVTTNKARVQDGFKINSTNFQLCTNFFQSFFSISTGLYIVKAANGSHDAPRGPLDAQSWKMLQTPIHHHHIYFLRIQKYDQWQINRCNRKAARKAQNSPPV